MNIEISKEIKEVSPSLKLGILCASVDVVDSIEEIKELVNEEVEKIKDKYTISNYKNDALEQARQTYRKLGKDPTRYRISSDSLFRRIIKNKGVYYVNNVVDINNLISLKTLWSIGAYDLSHLNGDIKYTLGLAEDQYEGIGRGPINIENLPVLADDIGPFGSAMSDSMRTMVTEKTKSLMMVIHAFDGHESICDYLEMMKLLLIKHANGRDFNSFIIE